MSTTNEDVANEFLHEEYVPPLRSESSDALIGTRASQDHTSVDVVFVQGLASWYTTTWSVEDASAKDGRYHWLRSKLPQDIPNARILTFEYDSEWYENPSVVSLEDCGWWLLNALVRDRCHRGSSRLCRLHRKKPLILVGHSFGGLVIKQALALANHAMPHDDGQLRIDHANYTDVLTAIAGIIFLGTPHRGTNFSKMASFKMTMGSFLFGKQVHEELVHMLTPNNLELRFLQKQYAAVMRRSLPDTSVACFFETKNVNLPPAVVVDSMSACLEEATNIPMDANHFQLNKFTAGKDKNYDAFLEKLLDMVLVSDQIISKRVFLNQYDNTSASFNLQNLKRWLNPSAESQQIYHNARVREQKTAPSTCAWVLDHALFRNWMSADGPNLPLWIHGQAGSGKSILCSFVIETLASEEAKITGTEPECMNANSHSWDGCTPRASVGVLYFLNGIDREHENSWSFLGTLIHQILAANTHNEAISQLALDACRNHRALSGVSTDEADNLKSILEGMLTFYERIYILVDGLEENMRLTDCLNAIQFLVGLPNVRLAFFSQDTSEVFNPLTAAFPNLAEISIRDYTKEDINNFAEMKVASLIHEREDLASKTNIIREKLQASANGIFQWVNESITYLASTAVTSDNIDGCLRDIPIGLHSTYEKVFGRVSLAPHSIRSKVRTALRWLAVSARPLRLRELWTAICLEAQGVETSDKLRSMLDSCSEAAITEEAVLDEVYQLMGSLVRFGHSKLHGYYVTLSHPSLRVAIAGGQEHSDRSPNSAFQFNETSAHTTCAHVCMAICAETAMCHAAAHRQVLPPLVDYAWTFWAYHLHCSKLSVNDASGSFDRMVLGVSQDVLTVLNAVISFSASHLVELRMRTRNVHTTMAVKLAQDSLCPTAKAITAVSNVTDFAPSFNAAEKNARAEFIRRPKKPPPTEPQRTFLSPLLDRLKSKSDCDKASSLQLDIDTLMEQRPGLKKTLPLESKCLADSARFLRLMALRFAVEPVAPLLSSKVQTQSLSLIHFIARTANLFEECTNYPYWSLIPANLSYTKRFAVLEGDPNFGPAKYVLQALEKVESSSTVAWDDHGLRLLEHKDSAMSQVTKAHQEHVQQINEMPADAYITATWSHRILEATFFTADDFWLRDSFIDNVKTAHVRASLMLDNVTAGVHDASSILSSYAPDALNRDEYRAFIASIPQLLKLAYIQYFVLIFEIVTGLTKTALANLINVIRQCYTESHYLIRKLRDSVDLQDIATLIPVVVGCVLYLLKCRYFPWYSSSYSILSWRDLWLGLRHPAAFLSIDSDMSFWRLMYEQYLKPFCFEVFSIFPELLLARKEEFPQVENMTALLKPLCVFYWCLIADRVAFRICYTVVTTVATGRVLFGSMETLTQVAIFSYYFWVTYVFGILTNAGRTLITSGLGLSLVSEIILVVVQLGALFAFMYYGGSIAGLFQKLLYPIWIPWWMVVKVWLLPWTRILRICGATTFVCMAGFAFFLTWQYVADPYGLRYSLLRLETAREIIKGELASYQVLTLDQIGQGKTLENKSETNPQINRRRRKIQLDDVTPERASKSVEIKSAVVYPPLSSSDLARYNTVIEMFRICQEETNRRYVTVNTAGIEILRKQYELARDQNMPPEKFLKPENWKQTEDQLRNVIMKLFPERYGSSGNSGSDSSSASITASDTANSGTGKSKTE